MAKFIYKKRIGRRSRKDTKLVNSVSVERKAFGDWQKAKLWMNAKAKNYDFELGLTSVADQNPFRKNEIKRSDG